MKKHDIVPDFELPDQFGEQHRLTELLVGGAVVLFFYPAAMTPGCTREACHFRDLTDELNEVGGRPVGISADPIAKQKKFSDKYGFTYPLLSDADGDVAQIFGVHRRFGPTPLKRSTFVIAQDRRVIEMISSEFSMRKHADAAVAALRAQPSCTDLGN